MVYLKYAYRLYVKFGVSKQVIIIDDCLVSHGLLLQICRICLSNCQGQILLYFILYCVFDWPVPAYIFAHWSNITCLPEGRNERARTRTHSQTQTHTHTHSHIHTHTYTHTEPVKTLRIGIITFYFMVIRAYCEILAHFPTKRVWSTATSWFPLFYAIYDKVICTSKTTLWLFLQWTSDTDVNISWRYCGPTPCCAL